MIEREIWENLGKRDTLLPTPILNYHRRHGLNCAGGHTPDSLSNEYEERKREWKNCVCPIYASGTLNSVAKKRATHQATGFSSSRT
jgi:hypothetical protein